MLTAERLRELVSYDPETGDFTALVYRRKVNVGSKIGWVDTSTGYVRAEIDKGVYRAHRLVWLYVYGAWPDGYLDHINRDRTDNRLSNLRLCSRNESACNRNFKGKNKTGVKGVNHRVTGKKRVRPFEVTIKVNGKQLYVGCYATLEEAQAARFAATIEHHGDFAVTEDII